ncbi:hypothetical protein [Candidatus Thiodiazotropha sp. LNASS1]|uniref:hypothetical protein n=1 Tax=Candidatus Thiodiazotropha sp. LNASS1 TaxID=3096260 RepID=UPI0034DF9D85
MTNIIILSAFVVFWIIGMIIEYRNPLWSEIVAKGEAISETGKVDKSAQMVFFWKSAPEYAKSDHTDYWNAMDVTCLTSGVLIRRPLILFGRRSVYIPWSQLEAGDTFRAWFLKRRALHIRGTELYLSVTERVYREKVSGNVEAQS